MYYNKVPTELSALFQDYKLPDLKQKSTAYKPTSAMLFKSTLIQFGLQTNAAVYFNHATGKKVVFDYVFCSMGNFVAFT